MSERGACRSCGAHVLWVDTANGKRVCLNYPPEKRFVLETAKNPMVAHQRNTYVAHFATCPDAERWRKGDAG